MHIGKQVFEDLDVSDLSIGTLTPWGTQHFQSEFHTPTSSFSELRRRQIPLLLFRHRTNHSLRDGLFKQIKEGIVPQVKLLSDAVDPTQDTRIHEAIQQIFWSKTSYGKFLNTQHFLLTAILVWKTLIIPGLSVVAPLLAIIMPFIVIRFLEGNSSVTVWDYISHVKQTLLQHVNVPSALRAKHNGDVFGKVLETLFVALTGITFITSIWNQIQSALHLRTIADDIRRRGEAIQATVSTAKSILEDLMHLPSHLRRGLRHFLTSGQRILQCFQGDWYPLSAYGFVWNAPSVLADLLMWIGQLDVWLAISRLEDICIPKFCKPERNGKHVLHVEALYHPALAAEKRVPNTVHIGSSNTTASQHVLLTGPNRGGKSTFCKALGLAIFVSQTWGFAWARSMSVTPYTVLVTALRPTDTLGHLSLFESEIEFARDVLEHARRCSKTRTPVFVMMDEIFHSTNAHDGFEATRVFLDQLYNTGPHVTSLISTHYRGLTDIFMERVLTWSVEAHGEESLNYTYRVIPGVSNKSSVMEILRERGLLVSVPVDTA